MTGQRRTLFLISTAIVIITLAAYEHVRNNDFIGLDDTAYVTDNPDINSGITFNSIKIAFARTYSANWHPLTWLSHMLDCQIYGLNPSGHHITNLLIHVINSVLLFWVLWKMTKAIWVSAFVAAMFALHPLHVESVAWISERKDVLSTMFWLLTMLAYARYVKKPNFRRYLLVSLTFILGLMSKPMVVTLPFVLLLLDYWPLERIRRQRTENRGQKTENTGGVSIGRLIEEKIPLFMLSAILSVVTFVTQKGGGAVIALEKIPLNERIANMFVSYIRYIGKSIWPSRLAVIYPHPHIKLHETMAVICAILLVLITIMIIKTGLQRKYLITGWLWFIGTLVPVIGLVQVGTQAMADRYMYIPMVGLLIIAGWSAKDLIRNKPRWKTFAAISAIIVLSSAFILTRIQVGRWQNNITLFEYATKVTTNNSRVETDYGIALAAAERFDEAALHLGKAVRQDPSNIEALNYLGKVFLNQNKFDEAIECFNAIIKQKPYFAEAHYNLGMAFGMKGQNDEAIKCFGMTMTLDPEYPGIQKRMGTALLAAGRPDEAIEYLKNAIRTSPDDIFNYLSISIAYIKSGKYDLAAENWTHVKKLQPDAEGILRNPGWLIVIAGDVSPEDVNKVIGFAGRACEKTGDKDPDLLDTLAAAYAADGRFEDAVKTAQKAIDAAKTSGQDKLADEIQKRIELYKTGQRYIEK